MTKLPKILGLTVALGLSASASAQMMINGAGATFPYPIYSKWFDEYATVDPSVRFNYQSIGSGGGQKQIMAQTVDFGASDGPMSDENLSKAPGKILHIPTVAGAIEFEPWVTLEVVSHHDGARDGRDMQDLPRRF